MSPTQVDFLIECQQKLIDSLTEDQSEIWFKYCETCTDGDVLDGIVGLCEFIEYGNLPR